MYIGRHILSGFLLLLPFQAMAQMNVVVEDGAVCISKTPAVTVREDTVVFNADAYRIEEGSNVDDLLNRIPGIQFDAGGNVSINGRQINQLYVNGKQYFGENIKSALKNMPADMIENVKTYERPSDVARLSGVDDGQAEQVIDLTVKKSLMGKWRLKLNAGGGVSYDPQGKYRGRVNVSNMDKKSQISVIADANNITSLASFNNTSSNVTGSGSTGQRHYRDAGITFSLDSKSLQQSGHIQYDGRNTDRRYSSTAQNIYAKGGSFSSSDALNYGKPNNIVADYRLEWWSPSRLTSISFKPHFQYKMNDNFTESAGNTYDKDPQVVKDSSALVNSAKNTSINKTGALAFDASLQLSHEFREAKRGRKLSFFTHFWYSNTQGDYTAYNNTRYYKIKKNPDSVLVKNQYYNEGTSTSRILGKLMYNEPIVKHVYFQMSLQADYSYSDKNRDFYILDAAGANPSPSPELSSQGNYSLMSTQLLVDVRLWYKKFNATLGATVTPNNTWLNYLDGGQWMTSENFVLYAAPHIVFNYIQSKTAKLNFTYSSWVGRNSLYNMLPVASGTNPLYVHYGNPDLKPSYTHRAILDYKYFNPSKKRSVVLAAKFNLIQNSSSTSTIYDAVTGGRTTRQENVNGNWSFSGSAVYNDSFGNSPFSLCANLMWEYRNNVSLLYNNAIKMDETNTVRRAMTKAFVKGSYRHTWVEVDLSITGEYTLERNNLRPDMDRNPWRISPGTEFIFFLPQGARVSTDFSVLYQRGYYFSSLDREFYVWNLSASYPVLKKKLSIKLECKDILNQLPNTVCSFNSERRSCSIYQDTNAYCLLSLIYNFTPKKQ